MKSTHRHLPVIGWREWVSLPDLDVERMKVKVDTGARTSALHAFHLTEVLRGDQAWVSFEIHPRQRSTQGAVSVECPVSGWREVRSSNGVLQRRPLIRSRLAIGDAVWPIDITLTNRDEMGFRMLLGRAAVRRRFLVDPGRSYLGGTAGSRPESGR